MRKKTKIVLSAAAGVLCLGLMIGGAACGKSRTNSVDEPQDVTQNVSGGVVHVLESGEPAASLGKEGDMCLVASTGEIYRKSAAGWLAASFQDYSIAGNNITVNFTDGSTVTYAMAAEAGEEHIHTPGGTVFTIYEPKCIVPGIGVQKCTACGESVMVSIAPNPNAHDFIEKNYGKCAHCGLIDAHGGEPIPGFEVKESEQLEEVFGQVENGDTIVLDSDLTITDSSDLNVSDKEITLDVKGNDVAIQKNQEESTGLCFDGGSLTITDSSATPESTERGKFTLQVTEADNQSARDEGTYALRINNTDLTIRNVDFEIINSTENNSHAMYVTGGKIDVQSDAKIIVKQGENADGHQTEGGYGIYISEGAEMNLNAATVESEGPIFPFVVGNNVKSEEKTVLNIKAGTKILYHNSACSYGAIDVYPNGVVNMEEGSKIVIDGKSLDPDKAEGSNYSNAMAFVVIGGGEVNFNGEIDLGLDLGMAYGFFILNNYGYFDNPEAELPSHIFLDARCTIGEKAKIIGSTEGGGGVRFFAVQRNGTERVYFDSEGDVLGYSDLELETDDAFYSVFIENGALITLDGVEAKKGVGAFAKIDEGYPGKGNANDHLGWFTDDAINDLRVFPQE